jgi:hypothetical protein
MSGRTTAWTAPVLGALMVLARVDGADAQPATFLSFASQPGDRVGEGRRFTLTTADGTIAASRIHSQGVSVSFAGPSSYWYLSFAAPGDAALVPGMYEGATEFHGRTPTRPGLEVWGRSGSCSDVAGRFVVLEAVYDGAGNVLRFAADYEQHCGESTPALYGSVRYSSAVPLVARVSIGSAVRDEGDFGTSAVALVASLSGPATRALTARYRTEDGTATAGVDYVASSGSVAISPGQSSFTILVSVIGDAVPEPDETFSVVLEEVSGAPVAFAAGVATIANDDPGKTILVFDSQPGDFIGRGERFALTPDDGSITLGVYPFNAARVHFSGSRSWSLSFSAPDGAPLAPGVYENAARWPSSDRSRPGLSVSGDGRGCNTLTGRFVVLEALYEGETLTRLAVDYEQHCEGAAPALFGTVRFRSAAPSPIRVFVEGGSATEGSGATITFKLRLTAPGAGPVAVSYTTVARTATSGIDYVPSYGTVVIPSGGLEASVPVPLIDDGDFEGNETLWLEVTGISGALSFGAAAEAAIVDDDPAPVASLDDASMREGDPGRPGTARVPLVLDRAAGRTIALAYTASAGTALEGRDFVASSGSVVIGPTQTRATIDVPLLADVEPEGDERLTVVLHASTDAEIGIEEAVLTIEDDDGPTDYYTVTPCRLLDSRVGAPALRPNGSIVFRGAGVCDVPATAKAVVVNVAAVSPAAAGHFRLGPTGTARPETSVLNFVAGQTRAAGPVISVLGLNDALTLYAVMGGGTTHAVVDVYGYFE